ncbi:24353_t:CDS:2 [Dentiscutata erythropus]|uniref:24353_t:CDS:1 n=1 Tax=Dentiscutata erythropus TaxID=1348616 RepID=A0A9N9JV29_9GLOM|nr:24353_t:CDS:2 [Dentiscutata erythropus]
MRIYNENSESSSSNAAKLENSDTTGYSKEASSTIRQRRRPSFNNISASKGTSKNNDGRSQNNKQLTYYLVALFVFLLLLIKMRSGQNISQVEEGLNFESITKIFNSGSEKLSSLAIPGTVFA